MAMKPDITTNGDLFTGQRSYAPEEVLAAGGTTAFGRKTLKNKLHVIEAIKNAPPIEPFTEEEWADLMEQLANDK
jgi:hypothetical protein